MKPILHIQSFLGCLFIHVRSYGLPVSSMNLNDYLPPEPQMLGERVAVKARGPCQAESSPRAAARSSEFRWRSQGVTQRLGL